MKTESIISTQASSVITVTTQAIISLKDLKEATLIVSFSNQNIAITI